MNKAVVRQSRFRHLFGTPGQSDELYRGVRIGSGISAESAVLKASSKHFAFPWAITGTVCVVPITSKPSAISEEPPLISHEGQTVSDFHFSPFDPSQLLTAANDGSVRIFQVPEGASKGVAQSEALVTVPASTKRLLNAEFHPFAAGVIVATSAENDVKLFDVAAPDQARLTLAGHLKGNATSFSWNQDGSQLLVGAKDKFLHIFDPRAQTEAAKAADHPGAKAAKAIWHRAADKILSAGFTKTAERELAVYDPRKFQAPVSKLPIDASAASPMLFVDDDLGLIYLAGKGEGNIRLYELDEAGTLFPLTEFKSKDPQSGLAVLPKETCNRAKCEVARWLKLTPQYVVPLRFEVPRQNSAVYQEDLYPPTWDGKPSSSAEEWFGGASKLANRVALPPPAP